MLPDYRWKLSLLVFLKLVSISFSEEYCSADRTCNESQDILVKPRFFLYDINYPEGFNLRRDVYMRLAIFMHKLQKKGLHWHLVLPPWHHLYHWKSKEIGKQNLLPWSSFFDVMSMQRFSPVIEFDDYLQEVKRDPQIEQIYSLHHYKDAFSSPNWDWTDRWNFHDCDNSVVCEKKGCQDSPYIFDGSSYRGWFWGYRNLSSTSVKCISFQGSASLLGELLDIDDFVSSVMIDHAEVVLHDTFGDKLYWQCRRSMRFSRTLTKEADRFRSDVLGCNDTRDGTIRPRNWENEKIKRNAVGGPYVCAHLRRGDFLIGRANQVPSLQYAAEQIKKIIQSRELETVFITTDATDEEINDMRQHILPAKLVQYRPDLETKTELKDGGVAIVDQIICSYARYFIGTHESTFTFRIQEEREIIGFPMDTTFNLFCASPNKCFESSKWAIVY